MKTINLLVLFLLGILPMQAQESNVFNFEGTVTNQDGNPVPGASICIYRPNDETGVNEVEYYGTTDAEGHYVVSVTKNSNPYYSYNMSVNAVGYPNFVVRTPFTAGGSFYDYYPKETTLWNRLDFKKDQKSTIILPATPDPSLGRYYRYDHLEGTGGQTVVFVREDEPKANVPYVIFPNNDFSIDLNEYDYATLPEPSFVPLVPDQIYNPYGLYGTYSSIVGRFYVFDNTPDCCKGEAPNSPRVGPFRAYLYASMGTTTEFDSSCVFVGEQTGIESMNNVQRTMNNVLFDLQGRRIQGSPKHGVYIQNGKKVMK